MRVEFCGAVILLEARLKQAFIGVHVLIAAARQIEDYQIAGFEFWEARDESGEGMRGFESGNDAFGDGEQFGGFQSVLIGSRRVFGAMLIGEPSVFRTDGRVIEAGRNGMSCGDLAVFVLQDVGVGSLQNAGARTGEALIGAEARSVFAESVAAAAGFDANHFYVSVFQEFIEQSDGVRAATDTSIEMGRQTLFRGEDLFAGFTAD